MPGATFCTACGSPREPNGAFCTSCGAAVGGPAPPAPIGPAPAAGMGIGAKLAIGALALAAAGGGTWLAASPDSPLRSSHSPTAAAAETPAGDPAGSNSVDWDAVLGTLSVQVPEQVPYGDILTLSISISNPTSEVIGVFPWPDFGANWSPDNGAHRSNPAAAILEPGTSATWSAAAILRDPSAGLGTHQLPMRLAMDVRGPDGTWRYQDHQHELGLSVWAGIPAGPLDQTWDDKCTLEASIVATKDEYHAYRDSGVDAGDPELTRLENKLARLGSDLEAVDTAIKAAGACEIEAASCWCHPDTCSTACGGIGFGPSLEVPIVPPEFSP